VVILQLVEERKLALTDPVSRWVPRVPYGEHITVDHLLQHRSGLFSANEDARERAHPRYRTPHQSLRIARKHGAMFCPGQAWRYSNTGYTVLGLIIEAVEGQPYHAVVNRRIAERLDLSTLRALAPKEAPADVAPLVPADGTTPQIAPSWPFAAGAVVGSADDMLRFWHALLARRLLSEEHTARMFDPLYPMFDRGTWYGRGVMLYELPDRSGGTTTWLGHSGGTPGAKAVIAYAPAAQAFVAVALSGDGSAEASAHLLLQQLQGRE
jgi:D-alanyl-D-alanine carboxypeptidase